MGEVRGPPERADAGPVKRLEWANALRGLAALAVLGFHYCVVFWTKQDVAAGLARREPLYTGDEAVPRFARVLAAIPIDFGALGVALFFLLSGYVIAISLDRYSRRGFIIGRTMRVLPTYAAGYLVTCAVIWAILDPARELVPVRVLAGMVPGLPLLLGVPAPGDGIVWTLIIELVFYAVCLVGYRALTRRWYAILAAGLVCVVAQLLVDEPTVLVGSSIGGLRYIVLLSAPFIPVMLIGVTLSAYRRGQLPRLAAVLLAPALAAIHLTLLSTSKVVSGSLEYRLTFVGTIGVFALIWLVGDRWRPHPVANFFADISYPLYVVHPVLGYVLLSLLAAGGMRAPVAVLVAGATAITAAWLLHRLVEEPTHRLGQRWARMFAYEPHGTRDGSPGQGPPSTAGRDEPDRLAAQTAGTPSAQSAGGAAQAVTEAGAQPGTATVGGLGEPFDDESAGHLG